MLNVKVKVKRTKAINLLKRKDKKLTDYKKIHNDITKPLAKKETKKNFDNETAPDGRRWKPSKAALKENRKTLQDTLRLFEEQQSDQAYQLEGKTLNQVTYTDYGHVHNFGLEVRIFGRSDSHTFEKRQFAGFSEEGLREYETQVKKYIEARK